MGSMGKRNAFESRWNFASLAKDLDITLYGFSRKYRHYVLRISICFRIPTLFIMTSNDFKMISTFFYTDFQWRFDAHRQWPIRTFMKTMRNSLESICKSIGNPSESTWKSIGIALESRWKSRKAIHWGLCLSSYCEDHKESIGIHIEIPTKFVQNQKSNL